MSPVKVWLARAVVCLVAVAALSAISCFPRRHLFVRDGIYKPDGYLNDPHPKGVMGGITPAHEAGDSYAPVVENDFVSVASRPLSTFSADVDTASYSIVRRCLNEGHLPPADAVRIEELVNYFTYDYPAPQSGEHPVAISPELHPCPWNPEHYLLRIGVQTVRNNGKAQRILTEFPSACFQYDSVFDPPRNLVFLIDVSGSMSAKDRLPLVKKSLALLVEQLSDRDRVAIVTYAGESAVSLPPTPGNRYQAIMAAVKKLDAGGSTNGGDGIQRAYKLARESFIKGGVNRVILATDGDFNVGVTDQNDLVKLIEEQRKSGVYLTVLGFGMGNLKDATLEKLAHHGNGHYAYIDSEREARKLFVEQGAALVTVAKDVKFQVEFNPAHVGSYRLIGYEHRLMKDQDFDNDKKSGGDLGSGHTATALYELIPAGAQKLKYQPPTMPAADNGEWATVKLRYKDPEADTSKLVEEPVLLITHGFLSGPHVIEHFLTGTPDFHFAAAVAAFSMILRDSPHKGDATLKQVQKWAKDAIAQRHDGWHPPQGARQLTSGGVTEGESRESEFIELVKKAAKLKRGGAIARAIGK